jgi:hypothetical protein
MTRWFAATGVLVAAWCSGAPSAWADDTQVVCENRRKMCVAMCLEKTPAVGEYCKTRCDEAQQHCLAIRDLSRHTPAPSGFKFE